MVENPIVTAYFFAYNHEKFIGKGIESVLSQETSYAFKIIVVDDGSPDRTASIVEEYAKKYPGKVFLEGTKENHGLNWQWERAILKCDTKYFCITGGDDHWISNNKIQKEVDLLESHPNTSMVLTGVTNVDEETGREFPVSTPWSWNMPKDRHERLCSLFLGKNQGGYPRMSTACIRTDIIQKCLREHSEIIRWPIPGEGTTILTGICEYGGEIEYLPINTVAYLIRKHSLSHNPNPLKQLKYVFGYTELRYFVMNDLHMDPHKISIYTKELINNDFQYAINNKQIRDLKTIVEKSSLNADLKHYFLYLYCFRIIYILKRKLSTLKNISVSLLKKSFESNA